MWNTKRYPMSPGCGIGQVNAGTLLVLLFSLTGCDNTAENNLADNRVTQGSLSDPVLIEAVDNNATGREDEPGNSNNESVNTVRYDAATDQLLIRVQEVSLAKLLGRITLQTGIETWIDEDFDPVISVDIEPQAVESALKQLLKDINHVVHYGRDQQGMTLVTGVEILRAGSENGAGLSIVPIYSQSSILANRYPSSRTLNLVQQRWQQRLAKMPEIQRREVEAHYQKKLEERDKEIAQRKQRKAERRQWREKLELEQKRRDEALLAEDPEFYEMRMQRREEMRQQYLQEQRAAN